MELYDFILNFLLIFSNVMLLMFITAVLYITSKKNDYQYLILLLLFEMIFKTILKDIFKIPPPPTSPSHNYGFPSGHIYFATVFYSWIAFYNRSRSLGIFNLIALTLSTIAIIVKGYHEVSWSIITFIMGILTTAVFYTMFKNSRKTEIINVLLIISLVLTLFAYSVFGALKIDLIISAYGTAGFICGLCVTEKYSNWILPIILLIVCSFCTMKMGYSLNKLQWFAIFFSIPLIKRYKLTRQPKK